MTTWVLSTCFFSQSPSERLLSSSGYKNSWMSPITRPNNSWRRGLNHYLTPLGILARNLPESSKILQSTFGSMPWSSKCTMHFRWSFIFSTYGLYFLPGSNFAPIWRGESTSFQQCSLDDFGGFGVVKDIKEIWLFSMHWFNGVSWPSGQAYRTQVLVLATECGFESRPWHLCPWARHLIIIASLNPGVKWVPVRAELVD